MKPRAAHPLAGALLAAAPPAAFLVGNAYPLASPEAAVLVAGAGLAGAVLGMAAARHAKLGALLLGAALALCLDFLYGTRFSKAALVLVPVLCIAFAWAFRRHAPVVIATVAATFLAGLLLIPATDARDADGQGGGAARAAGTGLPPVVLHLVLDEHIGLDGVPRELAQGREFRQWLASWYADHGFRIHAGAYSQYFDTRNALANLLNFTSHDGAWAHLAEDSHRPYVLARSAYFRHLSERGYALRVYQSDHIDFCRVPGQTYANCMVYRSNSIASVVGAALPAAERLQFILNSFLETSAYYTRLRDAYARLRSAVPQLALPAWGAGVSRAGPLMVLPVLERLERDLRAAKPGEAYFAHLLMPHYPYVLDESCRPRERIREWFYNVPVGAKDNTERTRAERYERYFAQIRCLQALLGRLFEAMQSAGVWEDAIVIVHGDHGSRIVRNLPWAQNAAQLTRSDFDDGFSTLFAVRKPEQAGEVAGLRPLQELLAEAFLIPLAPLPPKVYLRTPPGEPLLGVEPPQAP